MDAVADETAAVPFSIFTKGRTGSIERADMHSHTIALKMENVSQHQMIQGSRNITYHPRSLSRIKIDRVLVFIHHHEFELIDR